MKKILIILIVILAAAFYLKPAKAQEDVNYADQPVIDSDLDGLTDEGEKQIYKTDPANPDTDNDGIYDGAEIMNSSNPFSNESPMAVTTITQVIAEKETSWAWYLARTAGLVSFALLYISIFLGLSIRIPVLNKIIKPCYSFSIHCWISLQALIFILIHSLSLLFDKFISFGFKDAFIPFASQSEFVNRNFLALGIMGLYLMIILVVSSYLRRFIGQKLWRIIHYLNIILYISVVFHSFFIGTDLKIPVVRNVFIWFNAFLVFLMLVNLTFKILFRKRDEIICESNSPRQPEQSGENFRRRL